MLSPVRSWAIRGYGPGNHGPEDSRRSYVRSLLPRIFLATPGGGRSLLPGLPAVRSGVQIRLEDHAPHRARATRPAGIHRQAREGAGHQTLLGATGTAIEAEYPGALPGEEFEQLV